MPRTTSWLTPENLRAKLQEHPLEIEGAFVSFMSKARLYGQSKELCLTLGQWSRLWRVDVENATRIIKYLVTERILFSDYMVHVTEHVTDLCNVSVTLSVTNEVTKTADEREKNAKERERVRLAVAANRAKKKAEGECNEVGNGECNVVEENYPIYKKEEDKKEEKNNSSEVAPAPSLAESLPALAEFVKSFHEDRREQHPTLIKHVLTPHQISKCVKVVDQITRLDGLDLETQVKPALRWAARDDFWSRNVLSLAGLRDRSKNGLTKIQNILTAFEKHRKVEDPMASWVPKSMRQGQEVNQ
jgi:hypothetical protein